MNNKNVRIGTVLQNLGYINEEQMRKALAYQQENKGMRVGQALIELGFVTEKQVLEALAARLGLQTVDIANQRVDIEAVEKLPRQLAEKYEVLPVRSDGTKLTLLTNDPLNYYALEDVRQLTGEQQEILLVERSPLKRAISYYYAEVEAKSAAHTANQMQALEETDLTGEVGDEEGDDAPVVRLLNSLIQRAVSTHASDIHIEPFEENTIVRMRIDGLILEYVKLKQSLHQPLCARIKILANLDIAERRLPQDGHFRAPLPDGGSVNIRVSVLPTVFGEKVVIRLLDNRSVIDMAQHFGMDMESYKCFSPMLNCPNGIIYITGPTGSGKTTTLYMVLEYMAKRQVNIATIEDPVEKNLAHVNQTQVNVTAGLTFERGLRSLLRQDPDIIMVGETRDSETAAIAVRAAITGHVVFSTLHTNNAVSSVVRLADMGVERYMIANSLVGVVAQRLMRKCCPNCSRDVETTAAERAQLNMDVKTVRRGAGCPDCNYTGYQGRIAIHEIMNVDKTMRTMITENASAEKIEDYAKQHGLRTLEQVGKTLVLKGVTTPEELLKVTYYSD